MEGIDIAKLFQTGNLVYILIGLALLWAYKNGYLGGSKPAEPAKPDPAKPNDTPVIDFITAFLRKLLLGGFAANAVQSVQEDDAAVVSIASVLRNRPDLAKKLKDMLP